MASRSLRKVTRSVLPVDVLSVAAEVPVVPEVLVLSEVLWVVPADVVLLVVLEELLAEADSIANTRLLKSAFSVARRLSSVEEAEEVEEVSELLEVSPNSEIRFSSLLSKVEYADVAVAEVDDEELSLEADSDLIASKRSCISFPSACPGSWVELVELVEEVESVEEVEPSEAELPLPSGGGPPGGGGIERPIWFNACMTLCINVSSPPGFDWVPATCVPELAPPLFDCSS